MIFYEIAEPTKELPIFEPDIHKIEFECAFPKTQREWIRERDGQHCNFPILDEDGLFLGFRNDKKTETLKVHHILPEHYWKSFHESEYNQSLHHNPLNGITLSPEFHDKIHRDWVYSYHREYEALPPQFKAKMSKEAYLRYETAKGRESWLATYDWHFRAIATINSYEYVLVCKTFPFDPRFKKEILRKYSDLWRENPKFMQSYYDNR